MWPDVPLTGPIPTGPQGPVLRMHRITATRGQRRREIGCATDEHVAAYVAAVKASMRGWRVATEPFEYRSLFTTGLGDEEEDEE
jgi:hypothetical protein